MSSVRKRKKLIDTPDGKCTTTELLGLGDSVEDIPIPLSYIVSSTPARDDSIPEQEEAVIDKCTPERPADGVEDVPIPLSSTPARDDSSRKQKEAVIGQALAADPVDVSSLRQLAISRGGLLNDELRQKAWPKLLNVDVSNIPPKPDLEVLHGHRDYQQVVLDVNRSLKRFPPGMETDTRMAMQDQLVDVIMRVLCANEDLHYYQGFHDICVTFLLVVGEDITFALMDKLSKQHLRDFMDQNMERTKHILSYLYPIIGRTKPELRTFLEKSEVGTIFCLSWLITWYGHVLNEFRHIVRLYDFFIACHPLMPIYLGAAVVLYREKEVLATECDMPYVHSLLSKIPDDLPFEQLASQAGDLYIQFPPEDLAAEAKALYDASVAEQNSGRAARVAEMARRKEALQKKSRFRSLIPSGNNSHAGMLLRVGFWTLTAALSAAAVAMLRSSWRWQ